MNDELTSTYARTRARREAINEAEFRLGYFFATLENNIIAFRNQTGDTYSVASIAYRLGRLLTAKALREEPGLAQLLPEVQQGNSPALLGTGDQLGGHVEPEQAEVHVHARVGRPLGSRNGFKRPTGPFRDWTQEQKRAKWRADAQQWRDRKLAAAGKPIVRGGPKGYWATMTKEQRSAEMTRRLNMRGGPSPKQLRAMRANAKKAHAARKAKPRTHMSPERRKQMSEVMKAAYAKKRAAQAQQQQQAS